MKSFLMFIVAVIAGIIILANIGPLILFGVGLVALYFIYKQFIKAETTASKVVWILLGLFVLSVTISNVFALISLIAIYVLYVMFRQDKNENNPTTPKKTMDSNDPFTNFEREWAELNK